MQILVTTEQWFPDYIGGSGRVATESAIALAARGHDVTVVAPSHWGKPAVTVERGVELHRTLRRLDPFPRTFSDAPATWHATRKLLDRNFDVVLGHNVSSAVGGWAARRRLPLAYVFHASALREATHRRSTGVSAIEKVRSLGVEPWLGTLERVAAKRASSIFVLSDFSRELVRADHPEHASKVVKVGGGVDTVRYAPAADRDGVRAALGVQSGDRLLLTVRRLVPRMGIEALLKAFARIAGDISGLRLVIVGDGELRPELQVLTKQLGLADAVEFVGRLPDQEVLDWYRAADLFVLPTVAYEGFGISTAEALACGTPVVGTPVGATPEVIGPVGHDLVASSADERGLASAISRSLMRTQPELRAQCRRYALEQLSWSNVAEAWEGALERLVVGARTAPS